MTDPRGRFAETETTAAGTPRAGAGWGWILAYGVLSVVLGIMAFVSPFSATYAATLVIGAFLIAAGIVSIVSGFAGKGHEGRGYAIEFGLVSLVIGLIMAFGWGCVGCWRSGSGRGFGGARG
jgi:uncharacterized membrane protein HdeD (DUF308 family)